MQTLDNLPEETFEEAKLRITEIMEETAETQRRAMTEQGAQLMTRLRNRITEEAAHKQIMSDIRDQAAAMTRDNERTITQQGNRLQKDLEERCEHILAEIQSTSGRHRDNLRSMMNRHTAELQETAANALEEFRGDVTIAAADFVNQAVRNPEHLQRTPTPPAAHSTAPTANSTTPTEAPTTSEERYRVFRQRQEQERQEQERRAREQQHQEDHQRQPALTAWGQQDPNDILDRVDKMDEQFKPPRHTKPMDRMAALEFYNHLKEKFDKKRLPLKDFDELGPRTSCLPTDAAAELSATVINPISILIYRKIGTIIHPEDKQLEDIHQRYAITRNGYKALFDIMKHFHPHLKDVPALFGPPWQPEWNPRHYVNQLLITAQDDQRINGRQRTELDMVVEMVMRAQEHPKYRSVAHALKFLLSVFGRSHTVFTTFGLTELVDMFEEIHKTTTESDLAFVSPIREPYLQNSVVNKFNSRGTSPSGNQISGEQDGQTQQYGHRTNYGGYNKGGRGPPRTLREKVQCEMCMQFGHSPKHRDHVCREAAKIYWVLDGLGIFPNIANLVGAEAKAKLTQLKKNAETF
eukprot:scaffold3887_cov171-Cylindrotheca_fusiformis.AAC.1